MKKVILILFTICFSSVVSITANSNSTQIKHLNKIIGFKNTNNYTKVVSQDENIFTYNSPLSSLDGKNLSNTNVETRSSLGDENYILKNINYSNKNEIEATYTNSNCFVRKPVYKNFSYYDNVHVGDIIIETKCHNFLLTNIVNNPGHVALVVEKNANSAYGNYIKTIEVVAGGVQFGFLDDERFFKFGVEIFRPDHYFEENLSVAMAIDFAKEQLGKPYSFDITRTNIDAKSSHWYCSELVYAAYLNAAVKVGEINNSGSVMPYDILYSTNIGIVPFYYFVDIRINKYYGNKNGYYLEVINATNENIMLEYNTKMCNYGDAANRINLNDIKTISLSAKTRTNVSISTNRFADTFAFSLKRNGKRLITTGQEVRSGSYYMATFKMERDL